MEKYHGNTVEYWKQNAEEDYLTTPISVLKYITVLEEQAEQLRQPHVMPSLPNGKRVLAALKELSDCFTDEERKTMFGNEA